MPRRVTVVIPNYNGRDLLPTVIPSALAQDYPDFELLVVDDASTDDSVAYLRSEWPQVRVVELSENSGFARACNVCIRAAESPLVALLNTDMEVEPDWLRELVDALKRDPQAGSASGKILNFYSRDAIDAAGDLMLRSGAAVNRGEGQPDDGRFDRARRVFAPCAGAALYRRELFDRVGLFDEDFHSYNEDMDLGFRAQLRGYTSLYVPAARSYHMKAATTGRAKHFFSRAQRRNAIWLIVKNYPGGLLMRFLPYIVARQVVYLASSVPHGMLREHLMAIGEAVRGLRRMLRKRREIQAARSVGNSDLRSAISPAPDGGWTFTNRLRRAITEVAPDRIVRRPESW